jgi:hypothetical protein
MILNSQIVLYGSSFWVFSLYIDLCQAGVPCVYIYPDTPHAYDYNNLPFLTTNPQDPPTRLFHNHKNAYQDALQESYQLGHAKLLECIKKLHLPIQPMQALAKPTQTFETQEWEWAATHNIWNVGRIQDDVFAYTNPNYGIDTHYTTWLDTVCSQLGAPKPYKGSIQNYTEPGLHGNGLSLQVTVDGASSVLSCEFCITDQGSWLRQESPLLSQVLSPMIAHCTIYSQSATPPRHTKYKNQYIYADSGHTQYATYQDMAWFMGPRFGLPMAGVGQTVLPDNIGTKSKWQAWHQIHADKSGLCLENLVDMPVQKTGYVSYLPCDEFPIVGSVSLGGRILGSMGFWGFEEVGGFFAKDIFYNMIMGTESPYFKGFTTKRFANTWV